MMGSLYHLIKHLVVQVVEQLSPQDAVVSLVAVHALHESLVLVDKATHSSPAAAKWVERGRLLHIQVHIISMTDGELFHSVLPSYTHTHVRIFFFQISSLCICV